MARLAAPGAGRNRDQSFYPLKHALKDCHVNPVAKSQTRSNLFEFYPHIRCELHARYEFSSNYRSNHLEAHKLRIGHGFQWRVDPSKYLASINNFRRRRYHAHVERHPKNDLACR